jgi:hypothetical protein
VNVKSMERYTLCGLAGHVFACICLSMFLTIHYFEQSVIMLNSYRLIGVGSGALICYPSSL